MKKVNMKQAMDLVVSAKLDQFICPNQLKTMVSLCRGEEGQFFINKIIEISGIINGMAKTYEQDGKGDDAIVSLHYFKGNGDWYITEKDVETEDEPGQHQAFGIAGIGYGAEMGYISIVELLENGVELDLHFKPCTVGELKTKLNVA